MHVAAPARAYEPAAQDPQDVDTDAPVTADAVPAGQLTQATEREAATVVEYVPLEQLVHDDELALNE